LPPEETSPEPCSLFSDDAAIVINGTALLTRPKKITASRLPEIKSVLKDLTWNIEETPEQEHGKAVILEGSDVLFTGKEIFVGIRKNGTNIEGALVVSRIFADLPVIPIQINAKMPLKYYVSVAADGVLTTTAEKEAISIRTVCFFYRLVISFPKGINFAKKQQNVCPYICFAHLKQNFLL
jgi:N-dimethylarginine dimethylaminohydrolase